MCMYSVSYIMKQQLLGILQKKLVIDFNVLSILTCKSIDLVLKLE